MHEINWTPEKKFIKFFVDFIKDKFPTYNSEDIVIYNKKPDKEYDHVRYKYSDINRMGVFYYYINNDGSTELSIPEKMYDVLRTYFAEEHISEYLPIWFYEEFGVLPDSFFVNG